MTVFDEVQLSFKSDKKSINIDIYRDSDQNNLEFGQIVFKVSEGKYIDIKKIFLKGFNNFYITGLSNNERSIVYSGVFQPWDSKSNVQKLEQDFNITEIKKPIVVTKQVSTSTDSKIKEVSQIVNDNVNIPKGVNTSTVNTVSKAPITNVDSSPITSNAKENKLLTKQESLRKLQKEIDLSWPNATWKGAKNVMVRSFHYKFDKNTTNGINKYEKPGDIRKFIVLLQKSGILSDIKVNPVTATLDVSSGIKISLVLGYLKIYNFNPYDIDILIFLSKGIQSEDLQKWIKTRLSNSSNKSTEIGKLEKDVISGENTPPTKHVNNLLEQYLEKNEN